MRTHVRFLRSMRSSKSPTPLSFPPPLSYWKNKGWKSFQEKLFLPDHEKASKSFLIKALQKAKALKADCILCTEKDAVKINSNEPFSQTIGYVKIKLVVTYGKEVFEKAISKMV